MSDEGNKPAAEAPADETTNLEQQVEAPKSETLPPPEEGGEPEKEAGQEDGDDGKSKRPSGAQRAKRREAALLNELSQRDRELEELRRRMPKSDGEKGDEERPPREEDFPDNWFGFQDAKAAYNARQAVREEFRRKEESEKVARQGEIVRERMIAHLERIEDAREVIVDFDEVLAEMKGVNVRQDVIDEIVSSDKSALLAYHLAKNPDKLRDLNQMSGRELAREIGRLEGSVRMPATRQQTKAPPPLAQVKGGASPGFDPFKTDDMDAYVKWRQGGGGKA